jgi:DNA-binding NtrC family response regulator
VTAMARRVLSTSWDAAVLKTRNLLIENAGYEVVTTRKGDVFLKLLRDEHFDVAVVGDSIVLDARVNLVTKAKLLKPDLPLVVLVQTAAEAQHLHALADYLVEALRDPEELIAAVRAAAGDEPSHYAASKT